MRKKESIGKSGRLYNDLTYGLNHARNLERSLADLIKHYPELSKKFGISHKDVILVKRILVKQHKMYYVLMDGKISEENIR